jgi:aspartate/methionine/tyrosine aminotransferase
MVPPPVPRPADTPPPLPARAQEFGFKGAGDPDWGNLGQGAPETSAIPNQPERSFTIKSNEDEAEYGDVNGRADLRDAIAGYYNRMYRDGKKSQYTRRNVAVVPGGRAGLSRLMASLHNINVGFFIPEYTAYTQLLSEFAGISPVPVAHDGLHGVKTSAKHLREQIRNQGLGAFLMSNPANPTGTVVSGK